MMVYEFINEYRIEKYDKKYVYVDGIQVSYPSPEVLLMGKKKPLVVEPQPEYDEATQYVQHYYEDGETHITQQWLILDIPQEVIEDESITDA